MPLDGSSMTRVELLSPVVRPAEPVPGLDTAALARELTARVAGEVRFDAGARAAYSTDASNYRQLPIGVVLPHTVEAAAQAVLVCAEFGAPILCRGGGTSLAGQCTNTAVVIDFSQYAHRLLSVDEGERTCWVEPGIVLAELNTLLGSHGLRFGPEPATHNHCTLGGMIGNNSCGSTAQSTGKSVDNVVALEVMLPDGTRLVTRNAARWCCGRIRSATSFTRRWLSRPWRYSRTPDGRWWFRGKRSVAD